MPRLSRAQHQAGCQAKRATILEAHGRSAEGVDDPTHGECGLPNKSTLYWKENGAGGRTYMTDEVGGGTIVWDTCLVDESTLLAAIVKERELARIEREIERE